MNIQHSSHRNSQGEQNGAYGRSCWTNQNILELKILEYIKNQEKRNTVDFISVGVQEKIKDLLESVPGKNQQEVLKIRMRQLALAKILVETHQKSEFYLVMAHYRIGQSYLKYKCLEKAIDHLTEAIKIVSRLPEIEQIKLYWSYIQTMLSKCYFQNNCFDDAFQNLTRARQIQQSLSVNIKVLDDIETLMLLSQCQFKLDNIKMAKEIIERAVKKIQEIKGIRSESYAFAGLIRGRIILKQTESESEINKQTKAVELMAQSIKILQEIKYEKKQEILDLWEQMVTRCNKLEMKQKQSEFLGKKYELLEQMHGYLDQKSLKAKRSYANALIEHSNFPQGITQFEEILQIQGEAYGDTSIQVAKTMKTLGKIHINSNLSQAKMYLQRALKIFESMKGKDKVIKQINTKLKQVKSGILLKQGKYS